MLIFRDYVKKHYQPWALLCSPAHTGAVIKCLQALEENSQDLLADIDPKLVSIVWCLNVCMDSSR